MNEWPLLVFTLLMQASIGLATVTIVCNRRIKDQLPQTQYIAIFKTAVIVMVLLAAIGLLASMLHLGQPLKAPNAILNIFNSWLSREILFTGAYLGVLCLSFIYILKIKKVSLPLLCIAAVLGLIDVYMMASIYTHTSVTAWMHMNTYIIFYGCTLTSGAALYALILIFNSPNFTSAGICKKILGCLFMIMGLGLAIRLLAYPFYTAYITQAEQTQSVLTFPLNSIAAYHQTFTLRLTGWGLALGSILLGGWGVFTFKKDNLKAQAQFSNNTLKLFAVPCLVILIAECILRYAFYSIH